MSWLHLAEDIAAEFAACQVAEVRSFASVLGRRYAMRDAWTAANRHRVRRTQLAYYYRDHEAKKARKRARDSRYRAERRAAR